MLLDISRVPQYVQARGVVDEWLAGSPVLYCMYMYSMNCEYCAGGFDCVITASFLALACGKILNRSNVAIC